MRERLITIDELEDLFGKNIPMSAVQVLVNVDGCSVEQVRGRLREISLPNHSLMREIIEALYVAEPYLEIALATAEGNGQAGTVAMIQHDQALLEAAISKAKGAQ